jgi:cytochrome c oxidase subunit 3
MTLTITNVNRKQFQAYPYHLVEASPWPILTSVSLLTLTVSAVMSFHGFAYGSSLLSLGFSITASGMILWFRDIITEGTYLGDHTSQVQRGLTIGVALFIVSEVFAFFSVF